MGDENPICTLGDYSRPSHEGYRNTIELPKGNNMVPLRSDTIWLVQNGCSFHRLRSEDPNQYLKDFLKLVDPLDLYSENRERTRLLPHHGIDLWLQVQIFYDRIDHTLKRTVDYATEGRLWNISVEKAWATIEELARYEDEGWNDLVAPGEGSLDYENPDIEQLLGVMECKVNTLMKDAISLMGKSESVFRLVTNEILKERIKENENKPRKIKKITRYPDTEDLEPLDDHKFSEILTKEVPSDTPKIISPKLLGVKHIRTIFTSPPLVRESTFGFKPGTNTNRNIESRYDAENSNSQITLQVLSSFVENTPPMTYPGEVEEIIRIPIEVEPLDEIPLEDLGLNTCNHDIPLSSREIPNFDEPKPQP
ncbi:hypothetical protein Tco_0642364 [Tanacetum coccineum]